MTSTTVQQAPRLWRTDLQRNDLSVPGCEVDQNRVEIIYVLEGTLEYDIDGEPPTTLNAREPCSSRPRRSTP